jgi:hypothetical protein
VYVVREPAASWEDDETQFQEFLRVLAQDFRTVRRVPGPVALHRWYWPLGSGAESWDERVNELVTALRIMRRDDSSDSLKSMVVWARWPVAMAMIARMLAAERGGPGLLIRQRVSDGRTPEVRQVNSRQPALTFSPVPDVAINGARNPDSVARRTGAAPSFRLALLPPVRQTVARPLVAEEFTHCGTIKVSRSGQVATVPFRGVRPTRVRILLLRLTVASWGPLAALAGPVPQAVTVGTPSSAMSPDAASAGSSRPFTLTAVDAEGTGITKAVDCVVREWRCPPPEWRAGGTHRWSDFEALAQGAVSWLSAQALRPADELLLLGSTMPQEIGLGIGIHVHRLAQESWPDHMYPLVWDGDARRFVIPHLDLGWEPLGRRDPGNT